MMTLRSTDQKAGKTNGTALLPCVDGRSAWVRRCKDLTAEHVADLGGPDNTSVAERSLVRRAAVITTELEILNVTSQAQPPRHGDEATVFGRVRRRLSSEWNSEKWFFDA